jgi:hypothetical protein
LFPHFLAVHQCVSPPGGIAYLVLARERELSRARYLLLLLKTVPGGMAGLEMVTLDRSPSRSYNSAYTTTPESSTLQAQ